jgi:non-ribosomal peptide synthetase component E (peptide arylation enzyme)
MPALLMRCLDVVERDKATCGLLVPRLFKILQETNQLEISATRLLAILNLGSPRAPEASRSSGSALQDMSGNPLFCFMCNGDESFQVIETKGSPVAPCARSILEGP